MWPEGDIREIRAEKSETGPCSSSCAVMNTLRVTLPERVGRKEGHI